VCFFHDEFQGCSKRRQTLGLPPVRAVFCVDALIGQAQTFDRPPGDQVLGHNLRRILWLDVPVPDRLGVNDDYRSVLALVKAAGFVDAHLAAQPSGLGQFLQLRVQLAASVCGAGGPRRTLGPHIVADKDVMFKCGQAAILLDNTAMACSFRLISD
jgi:hypothetical protein